MAHGKGSSGYSNGVLDAGKMKHRVCISSEEGAVESVASDNCPGPPLPLEEDGSLCTGVVLPKTTRER